MGFSPLAHHCAVDPNNCQEKQRRFGPSRGSLFNRLNGIAGCLSPQAAPSWHKMLKGR
jgi:hypothetical protein